MPFSAIQFSYIRFIAKWNATKSKKLKVPSMPAKALKIYLMESNRWLKAV